jgi:hypothetical protein
MAHMTGAPFRRELKRKVVGWKGLSDLFHPLTRRQVDERALIVMNLLGCGEEHTIRWGHKRRAAHV